MGLADSKKEKTKKKERRAPYQRPAIIYEGTITTRAGSPIGGSPGVDDGGADPADLFGG